MGEFFPIDKKEEFVYNYGAGRDQLTEIVTTDANGNRTVEYNLYNKLGTPYSYRGRFMNWEGNKLTSCGEKTYSYDASGRFANFKYEGDKLINDGRRYMYGVDGILGFFIGGRKYYFYQKNLFGDVVGIKEYDLTTAKTTNVAAYVYDAFGNHKVYSVTVDYNGNEHLTENTDPNFIGNYNPIRYRGYYYDIDTGYYFVGGRCYDPEIGRFIDPDLSNCFNIEHINGTNLYSYVIANPIMIKCHTTNSYKITAVSEYNSIIGCTIKPNNIPNETHSYNFTTLLSVFGLVNDGKSIYDGYEDYTRAKNRFPKIKRSKTVSRVFLGVSILLGLYEDVQNNYSNNNYSSEEKLKGFCVDASYTILSSLAMYALGNAIALIPGVNAIALIAFSATFLLGIALDYLVDKTEVLDVIKNNI